MQKLEENAYLERLGVEMIDLRCCTVLVNNVKEYAVISKIAMKQGFTWASGHDLTNIFCDFPTRLRFDEQCKVYYNASADSYERDYQCKDIVSMLGSLILKRKEGQLC